MDIVNSVKSAILNLVESNGYKLDEVTYQKEGNNYYLRIVIDKEGFVEVEDCVIVSRLINPVLDELDLIKEYYILDVCSKEKGRE